MARNIEIDWVKSPDIHTPWGFYGEQGGKWPAQMTPKEENDPSSESFLTLLSGFGDYM